MIYGLYRRLMVWGTPALTFYLRRRQLKGKEDTRRAHERRGRPTRPRPSGPLVWFHAASVGEALSLLALVDRFLAERVDLSVMMTTGTVTSAKLMHDRLPNRAFHQYIPVDHPDWVNSFLDYWQPDLVLWSESDFWPNMMMEIKQRGIPSALINARLSEKSFRRWKRVPDFIKALLSVFSLCLAQNDAEAERLKKLGAKNVSVAGNLKYAARPLPCDEGKLEKMHAAFAGRKTWVFASTHPGEEEIGLHVHAALKNEFPDLLTIIAPRHPHRGDEIVSMAKAQGLLVSQRSTGRLPSTNDDIYLCDTMGEMGLLFRAVPVVVMGGSFVTHGGHNPIEPARLDCAILYGPHMFNFLSVCADFEKEKATIPVANETELIEAIRRLMQSPEDRKALSSRAKEMTDARAGVVEEIMESLTPLLETLPPEEKIIKALEEE